MRKSLAALFIIGVLAATAAHAQTVPPNGSPTTVVPGNITIAVFANVDFSTIKEFVGVYELHSDGKYYFNGIQSSELTSSDMGAAVTAAGGYQQYLQTQVLPILNADILQVYYGQTPGIQPPTPGSDPLAFLNYNLETQFTFKSVNSVQTLSSK